MKLNINGDVNRTFCQNLCLIFFPGAKFPENEPENSGLPEVYIDVHEENGIIVADAVIVSGGTRTAGHGSARICDYVSRDRAVKTSVGRAVLEAGGKLNGTLPPWGILTGVRPAKIAAEMRKRGLDREGIVPALMSEFMVREDKARLLADVNATEEKAVSLAERDTCSLYISIPFCPTRCAYCSFVSYATPAYLATLPDYLDVLCQDIERVCREIKESGERLLTVYIGGGTPTVLDGKQLDRLLSVVRKSIGDTRLLEFTVEAGRPDTVTAEKFDVMLSHGVDRTSINPQILDDGVLELIGRRHTAADFYRAYETARKSGIACINTDLIAGLPGSDAAMFADTVDLHRRTSRFTHTVSSAPRNSRKRRRLRATVSGSIPIPAATLRSASIIRRRRCMPRDTCRIISIVRRTLREILKTSAFQSRVMRDFITFSSWKSFRISARSVPAP